MESGNTSTDKEDKPSSLNLTLEQINKQTNKSKLTAAKAEVIAINGLVKL